MYDNQQDREWFRAMARIQLEIDGMDQNVSDEWVDDLFDEFDADQSGTIDMVEWEKVLIMIDFILYEK